MKEFATKEPILSILDQIPFKKIPGYKKVKRKPRKVSSFGKKMTADQPRKALPL